MFVSLRNLLIVGQSLLVVATTTTTQVVDQRELLTGLAPMIMGMIPETIKGAIPQECKGNDDAELEQAVQCAVDNLTSCGGLVTLIPEFATLPLPEAVDTCDDVQTPFCLFAEACAPCDAEFEALVTCFVLQSDNISKAVEDLVNGCSLGCDDAAADDADMMDADGEDIDVDVDDDALSNSTEMMIEEIVDVTVSGIRVDVTVTTTGNATANETETNEETEEEDAANEAE